MNNKQKDRDYIVTELVYYLAQSSYPQHTSDLNFITSTHFFSSFFSLISELHSSSPISPNTLYTWPTSFFSFSCAALLACTLKKEKISFNLASLKT